MQENKEGDFSEYHVKLVGEAKEKKNYRANNPPAVPSLEDGTPVWYSASNCDESPAAAAAAAA